MNSKILIFLALFLSMAKLAPSVKSLLDLDSKTVLAMDLNEEEPLKEFNEEIAQPEFVEFNTFDHLFDFMENLGSNNNDIFNKTYKTSLDILLPPPRSIA